MKLRIHENTLRIRVNRPDLHTLMRDGYIEHELVLAADASLTYRLELADTDQVSARFHKAVICVCIPRRLASAWSADDEVTISARQQIDAQRTLEILIEKDFACLVPRPGEDQSDYFENPAGNPE